MARLAEFARSQPQAIYAAFTFGLRRRWMYFMRTLPDIENLLQSFAFFDIRVCHPNADSYRDLRPSKSTGFMKMKRSENVTLASQK